MRSLRIKVTLVWVGIAGLAGGAMMAVSLGAGQLALGLLGAQILFAAVFMHLVNCGTQRRLEQLKRQVEAGGPVAVDGECADLGESMGKVLETQRADVSAHQDQLAVVLEAEARAWQAAQAVLDESPHGIALVSPSGRVELVNGRGMRLGLERDKTIETVPHEWLRELVARAMQTRQRARVESKEKGGGQENGGGRNGMVAVLEEGREVLFEPEGHPVVDGKGVLTGVVLILADVTEMRRTEESRVKQLSSFTHEIRTPMTSLQMSIYLLLEDAASRLTPRQLELLKAAKDDADRLHRIVEEALGRRKSEVESGKGA